MNRTYITPQTLVFGLHGQTLMLETSMAVGSGTVSDSEDIGFVKDNSQRGNPVDWDEDWK